jgi:hypothetical protein
VLAGVVDTAAKFLVGDNDPAVNLLSVTPTSVIRVCGVPMTPAKNVSAMSLTPAIKLFPGVVDIGQK